jgi:multiple sugar transport system ATP-binding protein
MAGVSFDGVTKTYPDGTTAVRDLDLEVRDGEFMVLVGPSGCGKTTALRMVAGLEDISRGVLKIGERVVNHVPSRDRDIAMVFQSYALYPHLSVYDNLAFGLKIKKVPKEEIERRVADAARILDLEPYMKRKPRALSGGQRQRVAMGRAIVREPAAFLMDEPLSNLDAKLRVQMRAEIAGLQQSLGVTTIYVTHDQVEAMTMGTRVAVMRKGLLQQCDDPQTLYDAPANLFVATFIGSPAMNLVQGTLSRNGHGLECTIGDAARLSLPAELGEERLARYEGREIGVGIRPEALQDAALAGDVPEGRRLRGTVDVTEALGSERLVHLRLDAAPVVTDEVEDAVEDADETVLQRLREESAERRATAVGRFDTASRVQAGERIEAAVDVRKLHFFDLESGRRI